MGSLASLVGQGESVSLMACSLCRCHLVIILRQPSASWSCRAWPLSLLGPVWLAGSMLLFLPSWPATPPASSVQKARLVKARGKKKRTHTEKQKKSKLWSLCHNVNWDKLMMHSQFLPGLPSQLTAWLLTLSAAGMQRYAAKINSSLPSLHNHFTCRWFHQESSSRDDYISKKYLLRESSYTNERSRYITKLIVSPKIFQKVPLSG